MELLQSGPDRACMRLVIIDITCDIVMTNFEGNQMLATSLVLHLSEISGFVVSD